MLHLNKPQNRIFIFKGLSVQIQHLPESARTQIFTLYCSGMTFGQNMQYVWRKGYD